MIHGRNPTADERRFMDRMGKLPCIACLCHGQNSPEISLHHIKGRTIENAHKFILPLCNYHHQSAAPEHIRAKYPWMVPVHACGSVGGKNAFEAENGSQEFLLELCLEVIKKVEAGTVCFTLAA